ncbi:MAG: AraC family transcriptional regulator [Spirochaetaceae bacterium]|nr:MAG: AraC family transcriptional regulator [Spirochaetaceae bacterium]
MHLLEILAALGAAQGVLLLLLIGLRFRFHKNLPLALLVVALSARLGTIPSWNQDVLLRFPWLLPAATPLPFLFGFLIWWYVRELRSTDDATPPLVGLHFLPYLLEMLAVAFTVYSMSSDEYRRFILDLFAGSPPRWMLVRNGFKVVFNIIYMALALRLAFGSAGALSSGRRLWVRLVATVPLLSLGAFAFVALYPPATASLAEGVAFPFAVVAAALLLIIYTLSLLALLFPDVLAPGCPDPEDDGEPAPATERITLNEECTRIARVAHERLLDGAFRNPSLNVRSMARDLRVHPNRLSQAVNGTFGISFPRMVNRMRVEYFLRQVEAGALQGENILELAFEAGFPSKSTFNRVFKEITGQAPSVFLSSRIEGDLDGEGGPGTGGAVHGDGAPVELDDPPGDGKTQS